MFSTVLKYGSTGEDVKRLQTILNKDGHGLTADGVFGRGTLSAVRSFQSSRGLSPDGVVGINTVTVLKVLSSRKYSIRWHNKYILVVSFPKFTHTIVDVIDSRGAFESVESMYNRLGKKPTFIFNGSLYDTRTGTSLASVIDEGVSKGVGYYSPYGLRYDTEDGISFTSVKKGAKEFVGFSPSLIIGGVIQTETKNLDSGFIYGLHPRTAFAESVDAYHIIMAHGRRSWLGHRGMSVPELKTFCFNTLHAINAGNFDGGGSCMLLNEYGKPMNKYLEKRKVDNAVAIYI